MERSLAAIVAADVVGYSSLMGEDEAATLAALQELLKDVIEPKVTQYRGRIVKLMGDGSLMEFPSVIEAVRFAVEVQLAVAERSPIELRIGINLGDIIIEDDDIFGNGVNVAARLEALAEPGGICISRSTRDQIRDRLDLTIEDLGQIEVKNIARPVRAFRIVLDDKAKSFATPVVLAREKRPRSLRPLGFAFAAVLLVAAGGLSIWQPWSVPMYGGPSENLALALPDKPSLAVLPFDNLSSGQDYFADGMTDDLITDLSKVEELFVIARNSAFAYEGKNVSAKRVARDLGVRYVLTGSVRRSGDSVRINAQLVDARAGKNVWAERYDGSMDNIFALQDRVTREIVSSLSLSIVGEAFDAFEAKTSGTAVPQAYDRFLRGWSSFQLQTPEGFAAAIPFFEEALSLDPEYSRAHAALAAIYWQAAEEKESTGHPGLWLGRLGISYEEMRRRGNAHLELALKHPTPLAYQVASGLYTREGRHDAAVEEARRAVQVDPNSPVGYEALAKALLYDGRPDAAIEAIATAMRLDPHYPATYQLWLGVALFNKEKFEKAAKAFQHVLERNPEEDTALIMLLSTLGHLGEISEAAEIRDRLNELRERRQRIFSEKAGDVEAGVDNLLIGPYTLRDVDFWPYKDSADRDRLRAGLVQAKVPVQAEEGVSPHRVEGAETITAAEARRLHEAGATFVDVRTLEVFRLGHIPGAVLLDLKSDFNEDNLEAVVAKEAPVVMYCEGPKCLRSSKACEKAVTWGFRKVSYFRDGFPSWKAGGYPVEQD